MIAGATMAPDLMRQLRDTHRANSEPHSSPMRRFLRLGRFHVLLPVMALLCLVLAPHLRADTISGTVKDPSGAVVIGARIEISGNNLAQPLLLTSDESGKFAAPNLSAGKYSLRVSKVGFDDLVTTVDLHGTADLQLGLTIATQQTSVTRSEESTAFANSDATYRQLRNDGLGDTFLCENFSFPMDVGTFELKSGTITFLAPVSKFQTGAVFAIRWRARAQNGYALRGLHRLSALEG